MKVLACISFLALLSFQIFLKVGIIGYYGINKDYITTNFCENTSKPEMHCNGKCYLKKQLEKADESQDAPRHPGPQNDKSEIQPYVLDSDGLLTYFAVTKIDLTNSTAFLKSQYVNFVFHPPAA